MSQLFKVNVSAINDFQHCPFRWWSRWVQNWVPRDESPALQFGKLLHEILEVSLKHSNMVEAIGLVAGTWHEEAMESTDSFERGSRLKALDQLDEISEALIQWKDQYVFQIPCLEVEQPFEIPHPLDDSIIMLGRPDRVAVMDGMVWHIQHKGLNRSVNFATFIELAKRSYHEHLYAEALSSKYGDSWSYGGTLFDLVRKLKYRTGVTKKKPEGDVKELSEMFWQHPLAIDLKSPLHAHVMESMLEWIYKMQTAELQYKMRGVIPAAREAANGGYYGNRPDEYFKVLIGQIELGDPRYFKKRTDMYATLQPEG